MSIASACIRTALLDAVCLPDDAIIYRDPNGGGFSWRAGSGMNVCSGPVGSEAEAYGPEGWFSDVGQEIATSVADALTAEWFAVSDES
jgi:hypothetical protein